jgi:hypothetical protein
MTVKEKRQLIELAKACEQTAARCDNNVLLAKTWVQESFAGLAERLRELAED